MRELTIALSAEVAGALVLLRQADESLEETAICVLIEARRAHVESPRDEPAEGTSSHV